MKFDKYSPDFTLEAASSSSASDRNTCFNASCQLWPRPRPTNLTLIVTMNHLAERFGYKLFHRKVIVRTHGVSDTQTDCTVRTTGMFDKIIFGRGRDMRTTGCVCRSEFNSKSPCWHTDSSTATHHIIWGRSPLLLMSLVEELCVLPELTVW